MPVVFLWVVNAVWTFVTSSYFVLRNILSVSSKMKRRVLFRKWMFYIGLGKVYTEGFSQSERRMKKLWRHDVSFEILASQLTVQPSIITYICIDLTHVLNYLILKWKSLVTFGTYNTNMSLPYLI